MPPRRPEPVTRRRAAFPLTASVLAALGGCSPAAVPSAPLPSTSAPIVAVPSTPPPQPESSLPVAPGVDASASGQPPAPDDAGARTKPPLLPVVSTTPGKISCETVECDLATEICCAPYHAQVGHCVARSAPAGCDSLEMIWSWCDEAADCGPGQRCCYAPRPTDSTYASFSCRKTCDEPEIEACLVGGGCSGKLSCKASFGSPQHGLCLSKRR